jgi:hypothetical protein
VLLEQAAREQCRHPAAGGISTPVSMQHSPRCSVADGCMPLCAIRCYSPCTGTACITWDATPSVRWPNRTSPKQPR